MIWLMVEKTFVGCAVVCKARAQPLRVHLQNMLPGHKFCRTGREQTSIRYAFIVLPRSCIMALTSSKRPDTHAMSCLCRSISGARVVAPGKQAVVAGHVFRDYGGHIDGWVYFRSVTPGRMPESLYPNCA